MTGKVMLNREHKYPRVKRIKSGSPDRVPSIFDDISDEVIHEQYEPKKLKPITIKFARHDKNRDIDEWELRSYRIISRLRKEQIYGKSLKRMIYYELLEGIGKDLESDGIIVDSDITDDIGRSVYCKLIAFMDQYHD